MLIMQISSRRSRLKSWCPFAALRELHRKFTLCSAWTHRDMHKITKALASLYAKLASTGFSVVFMRSRIDPTPRKWKCHFPLKIFCLESSRIDFFLWQNALYTLSPWIRCRQAPQLKLLMSEWVNEQCEERMQARPPEVCAKDLNLCCLFRVPSGLCRILIL